MNVAAARLAVLGNPIKHSLSPTIHQAFARQLGDAVQYRAVRVEPDNFESFVHGFFHDGGRGLNITLPFKERAFALTDQVSVRALRARAANTLLTDADGMLTADNTDGLGMVADMVGNQGWDLSARKALVLGAGGAVRGVMEPLLAQQPQRVFVANRSPSRAERLVSEFENLGVPLAAGAYDQIPDIPWDLIINGTAAGLSGDMPDLGMITLGDNCCCYDMVYGAEPTPFMRWAAARTAWAVSDGLGMLVEQAAESYRLWMMRRPDTAPVIEMLRALIADR